MYPLLDAASEFYRQALRSHPTRKAAVEYLKGRGLSGEVARDFGLGFAPPGWDNLLKHLGADTLQQKVMIDAGLLIENAETGKRYDRFLRSGDAPDSRQPWPHHRVRRQGARRRQAQVPELS